jgi:hypothetical protein
MSGAEAGVVLLLRERKVVQRFVDAGARSRSTSKSLDEIGAADNLIFRRLQRCSVIVEGGSGKWFVDELAWDRLRRQRRTTVAIIAFIALTATLIAYLLFR